MTSNGKNKLEDIVIEGVRQKLGQLIEEALGELKVLVEKEHADIATGHIPNNHWQARWHMEQRILTLQKALNALD